ncbi:MAG: HAMP domain-containing histidine kinase [Clostridiales bacterium]|nr:HAMP domain-containing histidine kinase [Clostridiales bacterium]
MKSQTRYKQRLSQKISTIIIFTLGVFLLVLGSVFLYITIAETWRVNEVAVAVIMILASVIVSVLIVFAYTVRRKLTVDRQVNKILDATEKIMAGDFKVDLIPAHVKGKYDEYDMIMVNVKRMLDELSKNEVLKIDFIANVSHEIKTPLSIIQNYATLMQDKNLTEKDRVEYAGSLIDASKRISNLVSNILKLSKLENRTITTPKKLVRLDSLLGDNILQFETALDKKNIELVCDIEEFDAYAETAVLDILFSNLISNAIKYSHDGGKINISLKRDGDRAVLTVEDFGIGMTKESGRHIFDKFYQADSSHSKEGNGLGMALVKRVIDVIGGEITVESELGVGSIFTVRFDTGMGDSGNGRAE